MDYNASHGLALLGFFAKKITSLFLYPIGMTLGFLVASLFFLRRSNRALGLSLLSVGIALLFVSSLPLTARLLVEPLELAAGPYCEHEDLRAKGVKYVVVLAGSLVLPELGPADRWGLSLPRVMEGIRLARALPESRLVLSGGCLPYIKSQPQAMATLPTEMGIAPERLIIEIGALDTADEARMLKKIVGEAPFALVTSATHIKRAERLFLEQGAHPTPCPCARRIWPPSPWYHWVTPHVSALKDTTEALHEYLGMV
ncbi:MAG: ElyC/SanA/YdcF family protein, partial [Desulfomonilaceae bacterium]